jgi:WD40 repeat protein
VAFAAATGGTFGFLVCRGKETEACGAMVEDRPTKAAPRPGEWSAANSTGRKALLATICVLAVVLLIEVLVLVLRTPHRWRIDLVIGGPDAEFMWAAWSPDGGRVLTASREEVAVWDATSGEVVRTFEYPGRVPFAVWSPDGEKILACGGNDGRNVCWDASNGERIFEFHCELQRSFSFGGIAQFSPDETMIATAGADYVARVWDARTGEPLHSLEGHAAELANVRFSPDGRKIATLGRNEIEKRTVTGRVTTTETRAGADPTCRIWDVATGACLRVLRFDAKRGARGVVWSPDGKQIAMWDLDAPALVWHADTGELVGELKDAHREAERLVYSPDGGRIASRSSYGSYLLLWDARSLELDSVLVGHIGMEVGGLAYSPDGRLLCSTGSFDMEYDVRVWDTRTARCVGLLKGREGGPYSAAFSPDGRRILTFGFGEPVLIWRP